MKKIPINEYNIVSNNLFDFKKLITIQNKHLYKDVAARIFFDANNNIFPDLNSIALFSFGINDPFIPMGDKNVLELENLEQVEAFQFASTTDTPSIIHVQIFKIV